MFPLGSSHLDVPTGIFPLGSSHLGMPHLPLEAVMPITLEVPEESAPPARAEAIVIADHSAMLGNEQVASGWFYGWLMLPLAMMVMVSTAAGQTFGLTFFNSHFRQAFDLTSTGLSATYLVATVIASLMIPYIGSLIDRFGMKRAVLLAVAAMALACVFASQVQGVATLFLAFVLLRTIGPGIMTLLANNTLAIWFDRRLGLASGMMQVGMAGAMAFVPIALLALIDAYGWRGAYLALAAIFAAGLLPLLLLVYRESPADVGQFPDGAQTQCPQRSKLAAAGLNIGEAMQHQAYWILLIAAATWALIGTGLVFHLESIFRNQGLGKVASARALSYLAIGMASMQIAGGLLADRVATRCLLITSISLIATSCTILATGGAALLTCGYAVHGCAQGLMTIVAGTAWPRYFGRAHLGKIRGTSLTAAIAGSSLGPLIMGVSIDTWNDFSPALWLFAAGAACVAVACFWAIPPAGSEAGSKLQPVSDA